MADNKAGDGGRKQPAPGGGGTFDKDTVFVCVRDCYLNRTRYRRGDELAGKTCPPHFRAKPAPAEEKQK